MPSTLHLHAGNPQDIERAAEILRGGGLVAFPTETVYGLGANALDPEAVSRIFVAKQRPHWDPLIVHLAEAGQTGLITQVAGSLRERVDRLTGAFWPGPLTLLLPRTAAFPAEVTSGRAAVGVRVPAHAVALALLRAAGLPVAAPSANRFGHVSPTTAQHVLDDLDGRIDAVLDGGPTSVGLESTVLDPATTPMCVYRAGAVDVDALAAVAGVRAELFVPAPGVAAASRESLPSPGVGLRHYAPETPVVLTGGTPCELEQALRDAGTEGKRACLMLPADWGFDVSPAVTVVPWGRWGDPASLAAELFHALRVAERAGADVILCPLPGAGGMGDALRDRLTKAAKLR